MKNNQSLIHLDLASTGLNEEGVKQLAQTLKDHSDFDDEQKFRNLRAIHLSYTDPLKKDELINEVNRILLGIPMSQKKDRQEAMEDEKEKLFEEMKSLQKLKTQKTFDKNFVG